MSTTDPSTANREPEAMPFSLAAATEEVARRLEAEQARIFDAIYEDTKDGSTKARRRNAAGGRCDEPKFRRESGKPFTAWQEVEITFKRPDLVAVAGCGEYTFEQLGCADERRSPTSADGEDRWTVDWQALVDLAQGEFNTERQEMAVRPIRQDEPDAQKKALHARHARQTKERDRRRKQVAGLSKKLRQWTGMTGDPFVRRDGQYLPRFRLYAEMENPENYST